MNASKFDRLTFERLKKYPQNTYTKIKEKFGFSDDQEFEDQLTRIYSDRDLAKSFISEMKKKEKKNMPKKRNKKTSNININAMSLSFEDSNVSCNPTDVENPTQDVAEEVVQTDEIKAEVIESELPEIEQLKSKLTESESFLNELNVSIDNDTQSCDTLITVLNECSEKLQKLQEEIEAEKVKATEAITKLYEIEGRLQDNTEMKKMAEEEIAALTTQIAELETVTIFFGNPENSNSKYTIIAENAEIDDTDVNTKLFELINDGSYEDLALGIIKRLARYVVIIEKAITENAGKKIVTVFDAKDDALVNIIKIIFNEVVIEVL